MSVSLCVLRVEVDEELPEMGDNPSENETVKEKKKRDRGSRESKTITVETYASVLTGPGSVPGLLPTSSRRTPPADADENDTIAFFCGNPLVEVTKGVLHLYKENELKEAEEAKTLCLLSVPAALGARDLLAFAAACQQDIAHVRVLRDGSLENYMALLTFRSCHAAREFHSAFDGVPYSTLEPASVCHMAWVSRVEWGRDGSPPPSHTELPTCPVCLERMDESVAGVLSVQCAHAFHADCLVRWRDASCPVCRCAQTPDPPPHTACLECQQDAENGPEESDESKNLSGLAEGLLDEGEGSTLWICLICGHVGCGRYQNGHAAKHFLASNHTYALQIGSNRVWDYAGDNFVHRLVQNKCDGKLVAAEGGAGGGGAGAGGEAGDKLQLTHLLTTHLDTQRQYYDAKIHKLEADHASECETLRTRAEEAEAGASGLRTRCDQLTRDNRQQDKKLQQLTAKVSSLQSSLAEERGLAAALAGNQAAWQGAAKLKEEAFHKEIADLKEQLRDVMFFLEARSSLEKAEGVAAEEVQSATVTVAPPEKPRRRKR